MRKEQLKTIKCKLKNILRKDIDYSRFLKCIKRANVVTFIGYHFLRFYILHCIEHNLDIPEINSKFIKQIFKSLCKESNGPKCKNINSDIKKLSNEFMKLINIKDKFDKTNLSYVLNYEETTIITAFTNNIKINFSKYLNQYINEICNVPRIHRITESVYNTLSDEEKEINRICIQNDRDLRKTLLKQLKPIKIDILNNKFESLWFSEEIQHIKKNILPICNSKTLIEDIDNNPFKYLKSMILMNSELENKERKMFQPIPLRTEFYDRYVSFNTGAIKDIFGEIKAKKKDEKSNSEIWKKYFNLSKYKIKGHIFNELISTDGTSVSISFMENNAFKRKKEVHKLMALASKEGKKKLKTLTKSEYEKYINDKQKVKENIKQKSKDIQKDAFKKLSKEQQDAIKLKMHLTKDEFQYIEDAVKDSAILEHLREQLNKNKIVLGDPGKRDLLYMYCNGKKYVYSNKRRIKEIKRKKYIKLRQNYYKKYIRNQILEEEKQLCSTSGKTVDYNKFKKYVKIKFQMLKKINKIDLNKYSNYINKLKWYAYINKRRHESKILNEIHGTFGDDATYIIGDWSQQNIMKGLSAPNMGIKRMLKKENEMYLIDEYNSSKKNYITKENMQHLKVEMLRKNAVKSVSLHAVLTYKMSNGNMGCINRDYNAVRNMENIVKELIKTLKRPKEFCR